jgi:hypothetical protein
MYFLLNDVVLNVQPTELTPPMTARRFAVLNFDSVRELGQELFSEFPMLQHTNPAQAERLATLILAKASRINAALFVAPAQGCPPGKVAVRFAELDFAAIVNLHERQVAGQLTPYVADQQVWRRMAA